jgi:hypothetical protein
VLNNAVNHHQRSTPKAPMTRTSSGRSLPSLLETINRVVHAPELAMFSRFSSTTLQSLESTGVSPLRITGAQRRHHTIPGNLAETLGEPDLLHR